jgi:glycerol-3-phosphate acyltransferase PlsY
MIAIAFLSGSIPFGLLIGRAKGIDIRKHGSGNIGATNVGRVLGTRYFFLCFFLDLLKGLLPTLAAGWALGRLGQFSMPSRDAWWWLGAMAAAVLGHVFTPWLKFKGGKGVATGLGALLGVFPVLTLAGAGAFLIWLAVFGIWRYISLASITAGILLPVIVFLEFLLPQRADLAHGAAPNVVWPFVAAGCALAVLVVWTHRSNIKRLRSGTELRAGRGSTGRLNRERPSPPPA